MPIYEWRCSKCGHFFETMQRMSDPAPLCPAPSGLPGTGHPNNVWADVWADAKKNFDAGRKTWWPSSVVDVGPDYEHTVITMTDDGKFTSKSQSLSAWLAESPGPCGGETVKQISRSSVHFKGSGFYATDYK